MADKQEPGNSTETQTKRRRRTAGGPPANDVGDTPKTGVPGTEDGPPSNWRGEHPHAHDDGDPEHNHPDGQDADATASQHSDLESFNQGPEANRQMDPDGPPEPSDADGGDTPELTRPRNAERSSTQDNDPQIGLGDDVINVEEKDGAALLKLFEVRAQNRKAASTFSKASADIKEHLKRLGKYTGKATTIKIGAHTFNLADLADDKVIEEFTRTGSQRSSIKHPAA